MSIESFFTVQVAPPNQPGGPAGNKGGALGGNAGLQGGSFLDLIFAQILEKVQNAAGENTAEDSAEETAADILAKNGLPGESSETTALQSDNPLLDKDPELNLADILAANPEIKEEVDAFVQATGLSGNAEIIQTLELNKQAFDDVLKPLTGGIITAENVEQGSPRILQALLIDTENTDGDLSPFINALKEKLKIISEGEDSNLINVNLTPEQLTQITNSEDVPADINALLIGIIAVTPAPAFATPQSNAANNAAAQIAAAPTLNTLTQGQQNGLPANDAGEPSFTIEEYEGSLQNLTTKSGKPGGEIAAVTGKAVTNNNAQGTPSFNILQAFPLPYGGDLGLPGSFAQDYLEQYGLTSQSSAPTQMGSMISTSVQAGQAGSPHPATHMVAITMKNAAQQGGERSFNIHLDPPELGRVEVQMSFGKDKTVKASMIVEKPETFIMLQRDAQVLERALQEAGLDIGEGMNFELAEQGFDFDDHNQRGGGHDSGGTGGGTSADGEEILETTMNWHVDPETGHMHYNILV